MKICLVTSSFPRYSGDYSGFFAYDHALALSRKHEVHVVYPTDVNTERDWDDRIVRHPVRYPFRTYPLAQVHGSDLLRVVPFLIALGMEAWHIKRRHKIDLIYAFWTIPSGFVCSLIRGNTPMLLGLMGSDLEVFGRQSLTRPFISRAIKSASGILAVSHALKAEAVRLGGKEDTIYVVPTGVDTSRFKPMDKAAARKKLGIPPGFVWVYSGSLLKLKRVDWILRLAAALANSYDFHVLIVGDGPERGQLERTAGSLGLKNVSFKGRVPRDEMPLYMAASDVLLLFSETEGLPNCIQEAMAAGIPVIATGVGGIPDVVQDGVTGYLVETESEAEERLRRLMFSEPSAFHMGLNALAYAREQLNIDAVLERIRRLCEATAAQDGLRASDK